MEDYMLFEVLLKIEKFLEVPRAVEFKKVP